MLECVINISEGQQLQLLDAIAATAGRELLDIHSDPDHNRSVLTVAGVDAPRLITRAAVELLNLSTHQGVHPRIGVVDVVPFVPLDSSTMNDAIAARDEFALWIADELEVPAFCYGPERTLPEIRRNAFSTLLPDFGPHSPHPTAGAVAVGAREVLVAWNLWLVEPDLELAQTIARELRGPGIRALGLAVGDEVQVSFNLIDPLQVGLVEVYDRVAEKAAIKRAELVGLVPDEVLAEIPTDRLRDLDLSADRTIGARLAAR